MKKINFYPYIISLYPIVDLYFTNTHQLEIDQILYPIGLVCICNLFLFYIFSSIFHKPLTPILIILIWTYIFYYISFYNLLNSIFEDFTFRKRNIILIWSLLFLILIFVFNKYEKLNRNINTFLNIYSLVLFIIILIKLINTLNINELDNKINNTFSKNINYNSNKNKRDIYLIILDGYPNNSTLLNLFSFDNSKFIHDLEEKSFHIFKKSNSNYSLTFLSIASMMNMEFLRTSVNQTNSINRKPIYNLIENNKVVQYLKNQNYKFINLSSGWAATDFFECADINVKQNNYLNEFSYYLINSSLLKDIFNFFGLNVNSNLTNVNYTFDQIEKIRFVSGPKFVLAHILAPHDTYIYNEKGNYENSINNSTNGFDKSRYLISLEILNNKVIKMINTIVNDKNNKPIVIIQSDHGSSSSFIPYTEKWNKPNSINLNERMKNFAAYYFPDKNNVFTDSISPVNTFRIVFNNYFNEKYNLFPNKIYFSNYEKPFDFIEY